MKVKYLGTLVAASVLGLGLVTSCAAPDAGKTDSGAEPTETAPDAAPADPGAAPAKP